MNDKKNVESILSELGKKIDQLIDETKKVGSKVSEETKKGMEDIKKQMERLEEEVKERSGNSGAKWTEAKSHLSSAADSLAKAVGSFFKKS